VNNGLGADSIHVYTLAIQGNNIFAGTWGGGVYLSSNNGSSWTPVNNGLPVNTFVRTLAIQGNNIYAGNSGSGVYLSSDNGKNWTAVNNGLPFNIRDFGSTSDLYDWVTTIAIQGNNIYAGEMYAGTDYGETWGLGVYVSSNNGSSWTIVGLSDYIVYTLAFQGNNIFAGTDNGVYLSSNDGRSWTQVNNGLTNLKVYTIAIQGNNIYAGTGEGVYVTSNK
jgi:hypothetical protein